MAGRRPRSAPMAALINGVYTPLIPGAATPTTPGLMSAAQAADVEAMATDDFPLGGQVSLSSNSSTSVLEVATLATRLGLVASKNYSCVIGARIQIFTTATPANCGFIDIMAMASIATDANNVATVTIASDNLSVDNTGKVKTAIQTATGTITASTGGFTVYATRVTDVAQTVKWTKVWIRDLTLCEAA